MSIETDQRIADLERRLAELQVYAPSQCGLCGGPYHMKNPHPDAGNINKLTEVGYGYECIPCLVRTRHQWVERAHKAEVGYRQVPKTADGVPIYPGMVIWRKPGEVLFSATVNAVCIQEGIVYLSTFRYEPALRATVRAIAYPDDCYSTEQAAAAALCNPRRGERKAVPDV